MTPPTPTTPQPVRVGSAALLGLAVAATAAPVGVGFKMIALTLTAAAALLLIFNHPYRRDVRAAVEARGATYRTSANQVMPLLPLWLALMALPTVHFNSTTAAWVTAGVVYLLAAGYSYLVIPHIDGTAHLRRQ
ncbi:hypothetical protein GC425_03905 [Corynebacterium sp. zg254]|uniref:Uncharacterized protein n=1 Tax=Corynebacterium zhongnanshanii TaxID=2768834 RepID=A0ABQ6VEV0_9CORY|nr:MULTISPECIES: hypothetical protein [Corynebacterium]KAB3522910.1 hypothetical protein F8377_01715 [Corynebacterium zhongnanshanii]MCR5914014.1 hypothetical protein [Corynebacterium sp. zg254]